ncbi:SHOCT domain-containing protein [Candidatus Saccharibacteria bacterium]|nr:SHOCT domain-containing protein [Candidatus Saccharibacteria bacterium]
MNVLASQRKLNGTSAIYSSNHMNFKVKVYINRIEYSGSFGKSVLDINKVAWVKLRHGGTGVIIETTEGKKNVMVVKPSDRLAFTDAILKVQALQPKRKQFKDTQTIRIDQLEKISEGVDEIEKLATLYDKGILSQEEFETKKKQILGL